MKTMTKNELVDWATQNGWKSDSFGHLQREHMGTKYRLKLQAKSVRYECKAAIGDHNEWVMLKSEFYSRILIAEGGKELMGLRMAIHKPGA